MTETRRLYAKDSSVPVSEIILPKLKSAFAALPAGGTGTAGGAS